MNRIATQPCITRVKRLRTAKTQIFNTLHETKINCEEQNSFCDTINDVRKYFISRKKEYEKNGWVSNRNLLSIHNTILNEVNAKQILDVATGTGIFGAYLKELIPNSNVIGLDICPELLEIAKTRSNQLVVASATDIPFEDSYFDLVSCRQGLQYMPHTIAIKEIKRVCRKDGHILLSHIVIPSDVERSWYIINHELKKPVKYTVFTEEDLRKMCEKNNFNIEIVKRTQMTSSLKESIKKSDYSMNNSKLIFEHYKNAPSFIKKKHAFRNINGDIMYRMQWVIILARRV